MATKGSGGRAPLRAARRLARRWRRGEAGDGRHGTPGAATAGATRPEHLLAMPLFSDLSPSEAAILSLFLRRLAVPAGTVVIAQGGRDADLYLIEEGQAEVRLRGAGGETTLLATLGPGDFFGEIAFVTGAERTADVVARTAMTLYGLGRDGYAILGDLAALEELARTGQARAAATRAVRERHAALA